MEIARALFNFLISCACPFKIHTHSSLITYFSIQTRTEMNSYRILLYISILLCSLLAEAWKKKAVLGIRIRIRIRIRRIHMFLGIPDTHPEPLVTSTAPAPDQAADPSIIKKPCYLLFCDFFMTFCQCSGPATGPGSVCFWASRIRIRIHFSEVRIRGCGSVPKCH